MKLFDSHCHLDDRAYDRDRDAVIQRAHAAGVRKLMVVGTTETSSRAAVSLAETHPDLHASVGVHPHEADRCTEASLGVLREFAENHKVCAWGEIGLDFYRMISPKAAQERWFVRQLEIAGELGLPVIFHERDSEGRFLDILNAHGGNHLTGVVHCFSGTRPELSGYLALGLHIGITGIVTLEKRGTALRRMVTEIPVERLLVETDAPYLTPSPERNRFRRNEPGFVASVLLKLAEVRGEAPDMLADAVWENTCRLYRVGPLP